MIELLELGIFINNYRKQFAGIGRDVFCDLQDGVQYQFPVPVHNGQVESVAGSFTKECPNGLRITVHSMFYCIMASVNWLSMPRNSRSDKNEQLPVAPVQDEEASLY